MTYMNAKRRGGRWLHNMSAPPETKIGFSSKSFADPSSRVRLLLPDGFPKTGASAMLRALGDKRRRIPKETAERDLREKIERHARKLKIPFVAAVLEQNPAAADTICNDPLTVITVLSKSSAHVYIRDKSPNLYAIRGDRSVVLILPKKGKLP